MTRKGVDLFKLEHLTIADISMKFRSTCCELRIPKREDSERETEQYLL
jgi:hypothetical protein